MNVIANKTAELTLHKREVEWIEQVVPGTRVVCEEGVLWLTQDGGGTDYILMPGDQFACQKRGRLLVEALRDTVVRIG